MNRRYMITGIAFIVVTAVVLALLQYVLRVQGAPTKLIIGIVVGLIGAGIAYMTAKEPTGTSA